MNIDKQIKFETYINRYLLDTSISHSVSIKKLNLEVKNNSFLQSIYFLYIFLFDKEKAFNNFTTDNDLYTSYYAFRVRFENREDLYRKLLKRSHGFEMEAQVYHHFLTYRENVIQRFENKISILLKIREVRESLNITDYRICKDLNINPGNFHSVYHMGVYRKMSLDRCIAVLDYLTQQQGD